MTKSKEDTCFDCKNFELCFFRHGIEKKIRNASGILNIDGDSRPKNYLDIYIAIGSSCLKYDKGRT